MWASSRQSSSSLHHLYLAPDEESWWWSLSSYIHHWEKWMRNISLCFVSRSGKYIDSSHFQKLSQPTLKNVLWASSLFISSDEWISVRSYLEPWEYPSPASSSVQTWSRDAGDMVERVYVRGRLMDGPDIKLGILQTAESEGESDWSFVVRKFFYSNQWNAFKASLPSQRNWERNTNSPSRRVRNSTQNLTTTRGFSWKTKNILCSSQDG